MDDDGTTVAEPAAAPKQRRRRPVLLVLVALAVVGLVFGFRWWTHPKLIQAAQAGIVTAPRPVARFPLYVGFSSSPLHGPHETITLHSARVNFSGNSARATAPLAVCTRRAVPDGTLAVGTSYASEAPVSKYCTRLRPIKDGMKMRIDDDREYFVAAVMPTRAGAAHITSLDISYSRGSRHLWQHGSQHFTADILVRVR